MCFSPPISPASSWDWSLLLPRFWRTSSHLSAIHDKPWGVSLLGGVDKRKWLVRLNTLGSRAVFRTRPLFSGHAASHSPATALLWSCNLQPDVTDGTRSWFWRRFNLTQRGPATIHAWNTLANRIRKTFGLHARYISKAAPDDFCGRRVTPLHRCSRTTKTMKSHKQSLVACYILD